MQSTTLTGAQPRTDEVDLRDPNVRLARFLDEGSPVPLGEAEDGSALSARGTVDGAGVIAFCTDARRMGGAMTAAGCRVVAAAIDAAAEAGLGSVGLWHSGGAALGEGVAAMEGVGSVFAAMTRASGRIPQISVVLGPAAGGAAYGPALTDIVVTAPAARVFITGPDVVRSVTGEQIDMEGLGGPEAHARKSGVVHVTASSEADAFARTRRLLDLLTRPGRFDPAAAAAEADRANPRELLPEQPKRAYDIHPLIDALLDRDGFEELQPRWAANIVVGLGRLAGGAVGVIANNPLRKGGCLDSLSAEKAARFVRMCDAFGVPLLVLVDVPGYLPGVRQEWEGVVRRGAKLLHAFAGTAVPRVTMITRKSYGGAYIAMNSRSLGATAVFAWPEAQIAVMGAASAVEILHRKKLAAAPPEERDGLREVLVVEHERIAGGVDRARAIGAVDEVIEPCDTRVRLAEAFRAAPLRRGIRDNTPL
jgi:acetyl-CoA/propionyl-CoA carboxylase carboxyl transferase subunit